MFSRLALVHKIRVLLRSTLRHCESSFLRGFLYQQLRLLHTYGVLIFRERSCNCNTNHSLLSFLPYLRNKRINITHIYISNELLSHTHTSHSTSLDNLAGHIRDIQQNLRVYTCASSRASRVEETGYEPTC